MTHTPEMTDVQFALQTMITRLAVGLSNLETGLQNTDADIRQKALYDFAHDPATRGYSRDEVEKLHDGFVYLLCAERGESGGDYLKRPSDIFPLEVYVMTRHIDINHQMYDRDHTDEEEDDLNRERRGTRNIVRRLRDPNYTGALPEVTYTGMTP